MTPSADELEIIDKGLRRAEHLLAKLEATLPRAEALLPLTPERLATMVDSDRTLLDAYLKRFEDAFEAGKTVFRSGLLLSGYGWPKLGYIDLVNEAERHDVIPSALAWFDVRDVRNSAAHEYAMDTEEQASLLTQAVQHGRTLVEQLGAATRDVRVRWTTAGGGEKP